MITVKQLTKVFASGTKAIDGLDLEVREGEIMGLLGPNGAGKSTTVRVLSTLSGFDSGEVHVAGYSIDSDPEKIRQSIGYVAQRTGVDYFLTGRENLRLQGHIYHMSRHDIDRRVAELAAYFQLKEHLDRTVKTYSGGMQRKLDIATALIHKPRLLFLDEPTLGLDTPSRHNLWQLIRRLNEEQGLTILLTTHYLDEADKLAHRVSIINKGRIAACDRPEKLKAEFRGEALVLSFSERDAAVERFAKTLQSWPLIKDQRFAQDKLHLYVEHGASAIADITKQASADGLVISHIALAQPTLDDVFLKYTGQTLDQKEDDGAQPWWAQWAGKGGGQWQKGGWAKEEAQNEHADSGGAKNTGTGAQGGSAQAWGNQEDWKKWAPQGGSDTKPGDSTGSKEDKSKAQSWQNDAKAWPKSSGGDAGDSKVGWDQSKSAQVNGEAQIKPLGDAGEDTKEVKAQAWQGDAKAWPNQTGGDTGDGNAWSKWDQSKSEWDGDEAAQSDDATGGQDGKDSPPSAHNATGAWPKPSSDDAGNGSAWSKWDQDKSGQNNEWTDNRDKKSKE